MILLATLALIFYRVKSISAGEGVDLPNCPGFDEVALSHDYVVNASLIEVNKLCGTPPFVFTAGQDIEISIFSSVEANKTKLHLNYALRELRHGSYPLEITEESWIQFTGSDSVGEAEKITQDPYENPDTEIELGEKVVGNENEYGLSSVATFSTQIPHLLAKIARGVEFQIVLVDQKGYIVLCKQMLVYLMDDQLSAYQRRPPPFPYFHYNPYRYYTSNKAIIAY